VAEPAAETLIHHHERDAAPRRRGGALERVYVGSLLSPTRSRASPRSGEGRACAGVLGELALDEPARRAHAAALGGEPEDSATAAIRLPRATAAR
jgi:hypothetical protein